MIEKLWNVLNELTGRKNKNNPSFLEANDKFITKPSEIANYLNDYFISKLENLRESMPNLSNDISHLLIRNKIMNGRNSKLKMVNANVDKVKEFLKNSKDKPPGVDGLESRLLKLAADEIAPALVHIINLSFTCGTCP